MPFPVVLYKGTLVICRGTGNEVKFQQVRSPNLGISLATMPKCLAISSSPYNDAICEAQQVKKFRQPTAPNFTRPFCSPRFRLSSPFRHDIRTSRPSGRVAKVFRFGDFVFTKFGFNLQPN
ncbi:hypothetical protein FNV43_RR12859 [Rhamnella rubrinervis]|uniref:Uncharacterized protein n=1 Tax=Rhamnella rubrinervis TaxID=2594499 RepID=A0A8K0H056_9ROSA|nr:hypothetical protein FNV43_RR12859 [Rhamnella rubrinervis]